MVESPKFIVEIAICQAVLRQSQFLFHCPYIDNPWFIPWLGKLNLNEFLTGSSFGARALTILVVATFIPMPDRQTGMLRFFRLLSILAKKYQVVFYVTEIVDQKTNYGIEAVEKYHQSLSALGIEVRGDVPGESTALIRNRKFDVILFEHYLSFHSGYFALRDIRFWQPKAVVMVDTIDVEFQRVYSRALVTQEQADIVAAETVKSTELAVYEKADVVVAISDADKNVLLDAKVRSPIEVISLIHEIPALEKEDNFSKQSLLFIGNFELDANVDAMVYFTREVLPLVQRVHHDVTLRIVGNSPPPVIRDLASESVEVLGFVPDLSSVYARCGVAVVPVRWGGGLKGKIIEAMSFGLPVVTTDKGVEGFGLSHRKNVLVAHDAESFASATIELFQDRELYDAIRRNGWKFARDNYSEDVIARKIEDIFSNVGRYRVKRLPISSRVKMGAQLLFDRHVRWRFNTVS